MFLVGTKGIKIPSSSSLTLHPLPLGDQTGCSPSNWGKGSGAGSRGAAKKAVSKSSIFCKRGIFFNSRGKITVVKEVKPDLEMRKRAG